MKKTANSITAALCAVLLCLSLVGCTPETEYDGKTITKIETVRTEGMDAFPCSYLRTFDFEAYTITDMRVADPNTVEELVPESKRDLFNNPLPVATFDGDKADGFVNKAKSLGFYTWKDRYVTTEEISDMGSETVTVYFTDGTVKSTYLYAKYPRRYEEVKSTFGEIIGADMYMR